MKAWIIPFVMCVGACSSKSSAATDAGVDTAIDASEVSADDACTQVSQARCEKLSACSAALFARRWASEAQCEAREKLTCLAALAATDTGNTPDSIVTCSAAITTATCDAVLGPAEPAACFPKMGTIASDGSCEFSAQCTTGYCSVGATSVCATCAVAPAAGDSCATAACGPTMNCVATTQLCQVPVALTGTCNSTLPCAEGLACVGATQTVDGTCQTELTTVGATCDPQRKTGPDCSAVAGLTCDTVAKLCVEASAAAAGQPCGLVGTVRTACAAGATCLIPAAATVGTCVAPANDSAACDPAQGIGCIIPAKCVPTADTGTAGTCVLPGSATCT
jgi:hypothetical protein